MNRLDKVGEKSKKAAEPVHQPKIVTRKKSSVKSFRGKMIQIEEKSEEIVVPEKQEAVTKSVEVNKTFSKDEILASYIG